MPTARFKRVNYRLSEHRAGGLSSPGLENPRSFREACNFCECLLVKKKRQAPGLPLSDFSNLAERHRFRDSCSSFRSSSLSCFRVDVFLLSKTFGGGGSSFRTRARPGGTFFPPVFNAVSFRTRFLQRAAAAPARRADRRRQRRSRGD